MQLTKSALTVQVVHVEWHENDHDESMKQIQYIADKANSVSGPLILMGNFNAEPNSTQVQTLITQTGLSNVWGK